MRGRGYSTLDLEDHIEHVFSLEMSSFEQHTIQTSFDGPRIHYGYTDNVGKSGEFGSFQTKIINSPQHLLATGASSPFVNDFDGSKEKALLLEEFYVV